MFNFSGRLVSARERYISEGCKIWQLLSNLNKKVKAKYIGNIKIPAKALSDFSTAVFIFTVVQHFRPTTFFG